MVSFMKGSLAVIMIAMLLVVPNTIANLAPQPLTQPGMEVIESVMPPRFEQRIEGLCSLYVRDYDEFCRLIDTESGGYSDALAPLLKFADGTSKRYPSQGLCQVNPSTRDRVKAVMNPLRFGDDLLDPINNAGWALSYLSVLESYYGEYRFRTYKGKPLHRYLAYIAYNKGEGWVDDYLAAGVMPVSNYAEKILFGSKVSLTVKSGYVSKVKEVDSPDAWTAMHDELFGVGFRALPKTPGRSSKSSRASIQDNENPK
jgi:Transglycosylase SLT domain